MGEYNSIMFISVFMLTMIYLTGQGASEIVDFSAQEDINLTETEREISLRFDDPAFSYTYYSTAKQGVVINATNYTNNAGFLESPHVSYPSSSGLDSSVDIYVEVDYPMNQSNFTLSEDALRYCQSLGCTPIPYDGFQTQYEGETPEVSWINANGNEVLNEDTVLKEIRYITNPSEIDRNFIEATAALVRVTTGYNYFNEVILTALTLVLSAIVITLGARGLPFF